MDNTHSMSEKVLSQLIELVNYQFEELGNNIADSLLLIELYNTSFEEKLLYSLQIQALFNRIAEEGDEILNYHKIAIINELKGYMSRLLIDIKEIPAKEIMTT